MCDIKLNAVCEECMANKKINQLSCCLLLCLHSQLFFDRAKLYSTFTIGHAHVRVVLCSFAVWHIRKCSDVCNFLKMLRYVCGSGIMLACLVYLR